MNYAVQVKEHLWNQVKEMAALPELFVKNPETDFTLKKKLDFETTMQLIITMEGSSTKKELLDFFEFSPNTATLSAFNQQRSKLLPDAFHFLFHEFNKSYPGEKDYRGYRLLACDGTDLNIARNPNDLDTYFQTLPDDKGYNQLHLMALYDLCNRRYTDVIIQPGRKKNEYSAMATLVDRCDACKKTIFIADRGFESYNTCAHVMEKGMFYLIRTRDVSSNGMLSSFDLPDEDEFDVDVSMLLTRKQRNIEKADRKKYKFIPRTSTFDFLDLHEHIYYPITLRAVRFHLTENSYETLITNLPREEFTIKELKMLYAKRWGIETSFRELKYAIGLTNFHAKKVEYIHQEIFARLILYNFCEIITTHIIVEQKQTKYEYQLNYTLAIHICKYFLKIKCGIAPPDIELLIKRELLPIRPGRSDPRKVKPKMVISFLYRVA